MLRTTLAVLAFAALPGIAIAQHAGHMDHGASQGAQAGDSASTRDFKAADAAMMKNMQVPYTGNADVDFRSHMIPHHQGAIDMAKVALEHAKDPATKVMAQKIIEDQEREIAEMKDWLAKNGK